MRFKDSPDLFGRGIGHGTCGDVTCGFCGETFNEGSDALAEKEGDHIYDGNDSVSTTCFAGKEICDCCFEKIEEEIWHRRKDVVKWIFERTRARQEEVDQEIKTLNKLISACF